MIHKTIDFYEYFGCVTIVKTIHYRILECTCIVQVSGNFEFTNKHFETNCINLIDASISCNQYFITFLNKRFLTYFIDTVRVHHRLSHILLQFIRPIF